MSAQPGKPIGTAEEPSNAPNTARSRDGTAGRMAAALTQLADKVPGLTKKGKVRACVLAIFDKSAPKSGPETPPKDKWPTEQRWDAQANEIAKCIKRKFPKADQAEIKNVLLDSHASPRKTLIDRVASKLA